MKYYTTLYNYPLSGGVEILLGNYLITNLNSNYVNDFPLFSVMLPSRTCDKKSFGFPIPKDYLYDLDKLCFVILNLKLNILSLSLTESPWYVFFFTFFCEDLLSLLLLQLSCFFLKCKQDLNIFLIKF